MWTSEIVECLDNPTIANIDVYRPKDGEQAGDSEEIDEADSCRHGEVTKKVSNIYVNSPWTHGPHQ